MSKSCLQRPLILLKFFDVDEGLLSSRYNQWIHDRRFMNQYFSTKKIQSYIASFYECADCLVDKINKKHSHTNNEIELLPLIEFCAVQGVCTTLFGMALEDERISDIYKKTSVIFETNTETFENGLKNPLQFLDIFYKRSSNYRKVKNAQKYLTDLLTNMKFESESGESDESLLQGLIKNGSEKFTKKQVREHILTFLNAGLDTTSAMINYTILFLAMNLNCQEKLAEEITENLQNATELDALLKMEYLDRVVKESFRLAPPIFLIGRETIEDFEILPGVIIPKDTALTINTFVLHRRKEIYGDDSHNFNPDNFLPEKIANRHSFSFQPFSTGRRNCIGYRFAIFFIKVVLVQLIKNFKFTTKSKYEDLRFKYGMTLKLTENHLLMVDKRNSK
ncbi:CLUMA_CG005979, isoform A [Clunio marinus]|uniref:CLUMA_CG005979, isoform A n=1 Tax=Clunio marinus TaxID=568069 RepID=A0A1J1I211_9DIPT|nr:CLUMA_CG005979, isoform A [Clunio marinus]